VGRESVVAVHVRDRRLVGQLARPLVPIRPRQPVRDQRQHVLTLTSHTTNRKTPTDHAPETPAGSTHGDAVIPSQAAVNNCSVRLPRRSRAAMRSTLIRCGGGVFGSQRRKPGVGMSGWPAFEVKHHHHHQYHRDHGNHRRLPADPLGRRQLAGRLPSRVQYHRRRRSSAETSPEPTTKCSGAAMTGTTDGRHGHDQERRPAPCAAPMRST